MSIGRLIGIVFGILVLFAIISNPVGAAATTSNFRSNLAAAGHQITTFLTSVVNTAAVNTTSTTSTSGHTHYYPSGGVETGDGSTPIDP
jgi:hypothetical protein